MNHKSARLTGGFRSHTGSPSHHPFLDGIFPYKSFMSGDPHDYGKPPNRPAHRISADGVDGVDSAGAILRG